VLCATGLLVVAGCGNGAVRSSAPPPSEAALPRAPTSSPQTAAERQAIGLALADYLTAVNGLVLAGRDCLVGTTNATSRKLCLRKATWSLDTSGRVVGRRIDRAVGRAEGSCAAQLRTVRRRFVAATKAVIPVKQAVMRVESSRAFKRLNVLHRDLNRVRYALTRADDLC
jgi:hypothetical protein